MQRKYHSNWNHADWLRYGVSGFLMLFFIPFHSVKATIEKSPEKNEQGIPVGLSGFYNKPDRFMRGRPLPLAVQAVSVSIPREIFVTRLHAAQNASNGSQFVDPISITVPADELKMRKFLMKIAEGKRLNDLVLNVKKNSLVSKESGEESRIFTFTPETISLIDKSKYFATLRKTHHRLTIETAKLSNDQARYLVNSVKPFLNSEQIRTVIEKIRNRQMLEVDKFVLPEFAKKVVENFTKYRGPNCFHAALAFQGLSIAKSPQVNVKEESGYHPSMINYDELWRVLRTSFYEINPEKDEIKYGDMIVFFDLPDSTRVKRDINFRWIRHAASYLFDGYVFSKGSKSANTPYIVRTLNEEWASWLGFSKNLYIKVYRRTALSPHEFVLSDLSDWNS